MNLIDLKERIILSTLFTKEESNFLLEAINANVKAHTAPVVVVENPPNYMGRIDAIWMVLSVDDGGEGIVAAPFGNLTLPLVAADKARLAQIVPVAREMAKFFGKPMRLTKFTVREDVEIYRP